MQKYSHSNVQILSLSVPRITEQQVDARISQFLSEAPKGRKIYTPNPLMALGCARSRPLTNFFRSADLLLPDGIGLVVASRCLRNPLSSRITGIDTAERILRMAEMQGKSVAFLGGKDGVPQKAVKALQEKFPLVSVCFTHHGYFDKRGKENQEILQNLRESKPDILFVCFGFPAQEIWIAKYAHSIPSLHLAMGLGGAFDVWAKEAKRAPRVWSNHGMEWLWRTLNDPKRRRNFLLLPAFLLAVLQSEHNRIRCRKNKKAKKGSTPKSASNFFDKSIRKFRRPTGIRIIGARIVVRTVIRTIIRIIIRAVIGIAAIVGFSALILRLFIFIVLLLIGTRDHADHHRKDQQNRNQSNQFLHDLPSNSIRENNTVIVLIFVVAVVKASHKDIFIGAHANELDFGGKVLCFIHVFHDNSPLFQATGLTLSR